ncbi:MAG: hypothetical protein JSS00_09825 [Proteobacteria bacterium]|nr:hypothetical protein [Pseudomonadota bacterium]
MRMKIALAGAMTLALAACQTVKIENAAGGTFDIGYDALRHGSLDADVAANRHCGGAATMVSDTAHDDGRHYRNYRCTRRR